MSTGQSSGGHYEKKSTEKYSVRELEAAKKHVDIIKSSGEFGFASLHHHTTFSFLDGYGMPEKHVQRAAELGMPAMAITEHGNMSSHPRFERAAAAAGIKPLFGVEMYTGPVDEERRKKRKNHLTLIAEDDRGYQNLLRLVERSYTEGFYYEPTIDGRMLAEHRKGIVVLSGCLGSLLATSIAGGKNVPEAKASLKRGLKVARQFHSTFPDSYFLEVQPFPELEKTCRVNQAVEEIAERTGIPIVVTGDVHYTSESETEMQQILHSIRGGARQTLEQLEAAWGHDVDLCHPTATRYLYERLRATGLGKRAAMQAIRNTLEIADRCNVTLPKAGKLRYPTPESMDSKQLWRQWLKDGWAYRECDSLPKQVRREYIKRVRHEMKVIEDKDFMDYFLVVSDAVRWAKDHGIAVGPARGSAAGSLVCWLLRITEVNPMLFPNLVFERFIDITREDEPDIDLDFDDERRDELRDYLVGKFGEDKVANIATFSFFRSKGALDDVARVYRIPQWEVDTIKGLMIERSSGDLRADSTIEDTAEMFTEVADVFERHPDLKKAMRLEGNIKGMSVHAAGLVVSNRPIREIAPMHRRPLGQEKKMVDVVGINKFDVELVGLLKMDFLGLKRMGMFAIALEYLDGMKLSDLYRIPLDDPETIRGFQENDVVGIFQFDGQATKDISGTIRPDSFNEVCHVNALARPGPLHNGATATYINVKHGLQEPRKLHPLYDAITEDTYYQIVYQEQILRIVTEIGDFDWTHRAYIRRLISRKMGEQEFNRQRSRFMKGAKKKGVPEDVAAEIWNGCITAGAYGFNAAHATSYGMLAWWSMWLKRHHPQVFYVSCLRKTDTGTPEGKAKQRRILQDAVAHDVPIYPPDVNRSGATWRPTKRGIRAGFTEIYGIGPKTANEILKYRRQVRGKLSWSDLIAVPGIGPVTIQKLQEFVHQEDPFNITKLERTLRKVRKVISSGELGDLPIPTHKAVDIPYEAGHDMDVVWCGMLTQRNLRDLFEFHLSKKGEPLDPSTVKHPELREWVVARAEDETEVTHITFSRYDYPRFKDKVWGTQLNQDVVLVEGKKRGFLNKRDILVKNMWVIDP